MPEFVNSSVWSPAGTRLALGTTVWPRSAKNSTNRRRISDGGQGRDPAGPGRGGRRHRPSWYRTAVRRSGTAARRRRIGARSRRVLRSARQPALESSRDACDRRARRGAARASPPMNRFERSLSPTSAPRRPPEARRARRGDARSRCASSGRPSCRSASGPAHRQPAFRDCGPSVARIATMPIASHATIERRRTSGKSPIARHVMPEPAADRRPGPRAEHRGDERQRQSSAGVAADQDVDAGVDEPDEERQRQRRPDRHAPDPPARGSDVRRRPALRRRRGDPPAAEARRRRRTARRPGPGAIAQTGVVGLDGPGAHRAPARAGSPAGPTRPTSGARWRIRTSARNGAQRRPRAAGRRRVGDERDVLERRSSASRGPRAGPGRSRWSPGRCATRSRGSPSATPRPLRWPDGEPGRAAVLARPASRRRRAPARAPAPSRRATGARRGSRRRARSRSPGSRACRRSPGRGRGRRRGPPAW